MFAESIKHLKKFMICLNVFSPGWVVYLKTGRKRNIKYLPGGNKRFKFIVLINRN